MPKIYFEKLHKEVCHFAKKPSPSINSLPEWWKNAPRFNENLTQHQIESGISTNNKATIKMCPAVNDAFNFGYTLFFPADIIIDSRDESEIIWKAPALDDSFYINDDTKTFITSHSFEQLVGFHKDESFHKHSLRINPMFGIKTEPGYSVFITHPLNRTDLPFRVIDAVIDTDKYTSRFPYSVFFKKGFHGVLKAGTPFLQVVPFKREDFSSELIDMDVEDAKRNSTMVKIFLINGYKKFMWSRKRFS